MVITFCDGLESYQGMKNLFADNKTYFIDYVKALIFVFV